ACAANNLFKGIPQQGLVLGSPSAPVEMEMFIDVQCPICQRYEVDSLPTIVQKYIKTGKVQLHLQPWAFLGGAGSQSFSGRLGLIAATFQNKGFDYAKVLYDNQGPEESGWLTSDEMARIAASVNGLDIAKWQKDVNSATAKSIAAETDTLASQKQVTGTPTIFIGPYGGKLHDIMPPGYAPTLQITETAIDKALKNA
ncbi:MAG TPA: thioredoxin domain-containing protein, partial [Gaiellaceae bacterium]|nr:thioredoxin domain-containing protein [Gaiellaceae bacterium]